MFPFYYDWTIILILPAFALAIWAQTRVKRTYRKFNQIANRAGITGAQTARKILDANGLLNVRVEKVAGELTDHYEPREKVVRLSQPVYESHSLAALAVAAHETGHAVQDQVGYVPMRIRAQLVPAANFGSSLAIPMFFVGLIFSTRMAWLMDLGIIFFAGAVLFHLVTLPVEFDASARALRVLSNGTYLAPDELAGARKVLRAAALTYVAAASVAVLTLLRLLILRNSRD